MHNAQTLTQTTTFCTYWSA